MQPQGSSLAPDQCNHFLRLFAVSKFFIFKVYPLLTLAVITISTGMGINDAPVANAGLPFGMLDQTGCCQRCPSCDHACKFKAESVEEEQEGFVVESKIICIPRVVFPWQKRPTCSGCTTATCEQCHNGGRTRKICVLKTEKYKCPKCEYSWSAEEKASGSRCCSGSCQDDSCDGRCEAKVGCDHHIFYLQSERATGMITDGT